MPNSPRVTVIVPMHDSERHLEQTLGSIRSQSYGAWHAVLVDDASRDRTPEIAAAFHRLEPSRSTIVTLERNAGVAAARNEGLAAAPPSELFALLDHDDFWLDGYLEAMVSAFESGVTAGRKVGIVASDALIADEEGLTSRRYSERTGPIEGIDYDSMIACNMICARAIFTRDALREVGGFSPECLGCDDYDFWLRVIEAGYAVEVAPEPLVAYREHGGALSSDRELMSKGALAAYHRALDRNRITARQRRAVRAQIRHFRALYERALVSRYVREGRFARSGGHALRAAPYGLIAFLQAPRRWGEWLRPRPRRARSTLS